MAASKAAPKREKAESPIWAFMRKHGTTGLFGNPGDNAQNRRPCLKDTAFAHSLEQMEVCETDPSLPRVHAAIVCEKNQFPQALVTLRSLKRAHASPREMLVSLLYTEKLSEEQLASLQGEEAPGFVVEALPRGEFLPFPEDEKLLLVRPGVIAREDLSPLWDTNLKGCVLAAPPNVTSIYNKEAPPLDCGVMLVNLPLARKYKDLDSMAKGKKASLPLRTCLRAAELYAHRKEWTLKSLNRRFHTNYACEKDLYTDAASIYFADACLPWENPDGPFAYEWQRVAQPLEKPFFHKEKYLISVVMPTYNVAPYIEATLDCILNQSCRDLELICADDGSTDGTLETLRRYEKLHPNMKVLAGENVNAGYERNIATDIAQGKYVYYMDSDDLVDTNALEIAADFAEAMKLDVAYFEGDSFYEDEKLEGKFSKLAEVIVRRHVYPEVYEGWDFYTRSRPHFEFVVQPCMKLTRLELLRENHIRFSEVKQMNDSLHSYKTVLAAKRCGVLPLSLYHRRVRNNSIVTNKHYKNAVLMAESRATIWVGLMLLAKQWKHKPQTYLYLGKAAERHMNDMLASFEKTGEVDDFSFIRKHWTPEEITQALVEWMHYTHMVDAKGKTVTMDQQKALAEKLGTKSFTLYLLALETKSMLLGKKK